MLYFEISLIDLIGLLVFGAALLIATLQSHDHVSFGSWSTFNCMLWLFPASLASKTTRINRPKKYACISPHRAFGIVCCVLQGWNWTELNKWPWLVLARLIFSPNSCSGDTGGVSVFWGWLSLNTQPPMQIGRALVLLDVGLNPLACREGAARGQAPPIYISSHLR